MRIPGKQWKEIAPRRPAGGVRGCGQEIDDNGSEGGLQPRRLNLNMREKGCFGKNVYALVQGGACHGAPLWQASMLLAVHEWMRVLVEWLTIVSLKTAGAGEKSWDKP